MKAVSLFSGVGGFEQGFDRAGIETVLQAERDPWCLEVLARHWPQTERVDDVRSVHDPRHGQDESAGVARELIDHGGIDLVYGGFPCQDLSVAGKRAGLGGERSGLWFEFRRVVSELRPRWVVVENVPGLHSSAQGEDFTVVATGLAELGYGLAWRILDAQFFGVPQRRRRVYIVATRDPLGRAGSERCAEILSLWPCCGGDIAAGRETREGTTGALSEGTLRAGGVNGGNNPAGGYLGDIANIPDIAGSLQVETYHHGGYQNQTMNGDNGHVIAVRTAQTSSNGWGIGTDEQAYTLDGTQGQAVNGVRRLTPRECERLMGWPDDFTRWAADGREIADSHRYRMAGNGVVAPVAEWIGRRLVAVDLSERQGVPNTP